jgi:integrase
MKKTRETAYIYFVPPALDAIDRYLKERNDNVPYLLITHGKGYPGKVQLPVGNGQPIPERMARDIVYDIAHHAFPDIDNNSFFGPHAFRHWHAQSLIDLGAPLDQVQSVLGHTSPETTKHTYARKPNQDSISNFEKLLHNQIEHL